jgi:hypothetical protein
MISCPEVAIRYIIASSWIIQPRGPKSSDSWNDGPGSWVIKDDFLFLGSISLLSAPLAYGLWNASLLLVEAR